MEMCDFCGEVKNEESLITICDSCLAKKEALRLAIQKVIDTAKIVRKVVHLSDNLFSQLELHQASALGALAKALDEFEEKDIKG